MSSDDEEDRVALLTPMDISCSPIPTTSQTEYEFSIVGMSCVACANNIEKSIHESFDSRGLQ